MSKDLVIVESPAKAKTITKYLGGDFTVKSSFGHVRDLPKKGLSIDKEHGFEPTYEISAEKKKIVSELKKAAHAADTVWLASDDDREGEAIAWHLCEALNLSDNKIRRIAFHEITKEAVESAIAHPRKLDSNLIDAQQARRVLDRLVGYELSPVLWKKVRAGLSAGRVQSVAVRLVVEREREIRTHKPNSFYKVTAQFSSGPDKIAAELNEKPSSSEVVEKLFEVCRSSRFTVGKLDTKPGTRNPGAPFTTSSLQQEAARRLGYSVSHTMRLAQELYENGHITYMRTDSTTLSTSALKAAEEYIVKNLGKEYHRKQEYQTKVKSAQEAHEAIRPTNFSKASAGSGPSMKLYQLIWQKTLASQMSPARLKRTEITIDISDAPQKFIASGEVLEFDGFMRVYGGTKDDVILPALKVGQTLLLDEAKAAETYGRAPARYSEATLVKKLEELGIGRPSTYAPIINTIQKRGYVENIDHPGEERTIKVIVLDDDHIETKEAVEAYGADKNRLSPTAVAEVTNDFLVKYFGPIVDYDFTATAENHLDKVAAGKQKWPDMIKDFYNNFHPLIEKSEKVSRKETSQARKLGNDPKSGQPIFARFGKYGPMLQRGEAEDEKKPDFAPLPEGARLETVTLAQALEMFKLPRYIGKTSEGEEITANIGRFGPYVKVGNIFVSLKNTDPLKVTLAEAKNLITAKKREEAKKHIKEFSGGIKVLNGPYGPYVTDGKRNAKIPETTDPHALSEGEAKELLAKPPAKKWRRGRPKQK